MLAITESFITIQGEGPNTGKIATFIRTAGCNLSCHWCFGVKPGRRIPRIYTKNGYKKIQDIKAGDVLYTFDDKQNIVETVVQNTLSREVDEWYEVKIGKRLYFITEDHPIFTKRGLVKVKDLKVGDVLYHITPNNGIEIKSIRKVELKKPSPVYNISCAPYNTYIVDDFWVHNCDTPFSSGVHNTKIEKTKFTPEGLAAHVASMLRRSSILVITGGEPMLQQRELTTFFDLVHDINPDIKIEIETAGTILPSPKFDFYVHQYNCSPKLANSKMPYEKRIHESLLRTIFNKGKTIFKFVVDGPEDLKEIQSIFSKIDPENNDNFKALRAKTYLMPEGQTLREQQIKMRTIAELCIEKGYQFSSRLHVLIWDDMRAV